MSAPTPSKPETTSPPALQPSRGVPPTTWTDTLLFSLGWAIKVLSVAAAVVFGIWAPLSYQATSNASVSGDAAQSSLVSAASAANAQASSALSVQSVAADAQSSALDAMNSRIGAIGQLWLLNFCARNTALTACRTFANEVPIASLVSYLASITESAIVSSAPPPPTSTSESSLIGNTSSSSSSLQGGSTSSVNEATPSSRPGGSKGSISGTALSLPAILGIVFAVIIFLGLIAGIFVSRLKRVRSRRHEEERP